MIKSDSFKPRDILIQYAAILMIPSFVFFAFFALCYISSYGELTWTKTKIIKEIMSCEAVKSIDAIKTHGNWNTRYYTVYVSFDDDSKIKLEKVGYKKWIKKNGMNKQTRTKDLHFDSLGIIDDYTPQRFVFNSSTPDACHILTIDETHEQFADGILNTLYENRDVRFLLDNYKKITEAYKAFPLLPDEFWDDKANFKKYGIHELQEEKGDVVVRIKAGGRSWNGWNADELNMRFVHVNRREDGTYIIHKPGAYYVR